MRVVEKEVRGERRGLTLTARLLSAVNGVVILGGVGCFAQRYGGMAIYLDAQVFCTCEPVWPSGKALGW